MKKLLLLLSLCAFSSISWCMEQPSTGGSTSSVSASAVTAPAVAVTVTPVTSSCNCVASAPSAPKDGRFVPSMQIEGFPNLPVRVIPMAMPSGIQHFLIASSSSSSSSSQSQIQLAAAPSIPEHEQLLKKIQEQNALIQQLLQENKSADAKTREYLEEAAVAAKRAADASERRADDLQAELESERCARCLEICCRPSRYDDDCSIRSKRKSKEEVDEDAKNCLIACCIVSSVYVLHKTGCCDWMCNECTSCCKHDNDETKDQDCDPKGKTE